MASLEPSTEIPFSLIKYEAEIEISENTEEYQKAKSNQKRLDPKPSPEDVLNNMIIPRDWTTYDSRHFMQYVSHQKPSRDDVFKLKEALDQALQQRQARPSGICPIRQSLYAEAFDEIIRQVTINSPERGLLLMRVRDEHKMTLAAYQTLYQQSVSFGMRKQLEAEEGMPDLEARLLAAEEERALFEEKKTQLLYKQQALTKKTRERASIDAERRQAQLASLQQQAENLAKFLESMNQKQEDK